MDKVKLIATLEQIVENKIVELGVPYTKKRQYNSAVDALVFKRSGNRIYCYVLNKDKTPQRTRANLVFRFKAGDNPQGWFQTTDENKLVSDWQQRFSNVWSSDSGASTMYREPARVTDQFGIRISVDDLSNDDFDEALELFLRIAIEAAIAAERKKDRDWSNYQKLIA